MWTLQVQKPGVPAFPFANKPFAVSIFLTVSATQQIVCRAGVPIAVSLHFADKVGRPPPALLVIAPQMPVTDARGEASGAL